MASRRFLGGALGQPPEAEDRRLTAMGFRDDLRSWTVQVLFGIRRVAKPVMDIPPVWKFVRDALELAWWTTFPIVRRETAGEGRWLDVGCADGQLAPHVPPERYLGMDNDARRIEFARKHHPEHEFVVADATEDLRHLGTFRGVLLVHVLHHLDDEQVRALGRRLRELLPPEGRVLIIDPRGEASFPRKPPTHLILRRLDLGQYHRPPARVNELLGLRVLRWGWLKGSLFFAGFWTVGELER